MKFIDNFIISLIILMATKLEKIQKIKVPKESNKNQSSKLAPFNQTIIINNPNININYLNDSNKINGPLSSRGLDNWNLNNNLKEFSETRQLGFFKGKGNKQSRIKSNSPYIIHKVKTQDLKGLNKVYGVKGMKQTLSNFNKNETFNHLTTIQQEKIQFNQPSIISKILGKPDKTITERFYNANIKKNNHKLQMNLKNFETLPTNYLNSYQQNLQMAPKSFRRNKFQIPIQTLPPFTQRQSQRGYQQAQTKMQERIQDKQDNDSLGIQHQSKNYLKKPIRIPEEKKRFFNKTIERINKNLLHQTDSYFNRSFNQIISQPEIQLFVNSLNNPEQYSKKKEEVIQRQYNEWIDYDFHFDEEKKKTNSPIKPKRKNLYEQV